MAKFSWSMFAHLAQMIAPMIVTSIDPKLAPLSTAIGAGIAEAESIPGAQGSDKLQHVLNLATDAAQGVNSATGKTVLDPTEFQASATQAINTTVAIINLVQSAQKAVQPPAPSAASTTTK